MLTIMMPDDSENRRRKRQRERWQAIGYLLAGAIIVASEFISFSSPFWFLPVAVEAWWLWAVMTQDWLR